MSEQEPKKEQPELDERFEEQPRTTEDLFTYGYHRIGGIAIPKDPMHRVDL